MGWGQTAVPSTLWTLAYKHCFTMSHQNRDCPLKTARGGWHSIAVPTPSMNQTFKCHFFLDPVLFPGKQTKINRNTPGNFLGNTLFKWRTSFLSNTGSPVSLSLPHCWPRPRGLSEAKSHPWGLNLGSRGPRRGWGSQDGHPQHQAGIADTRALEFPKH